MEVNEVYKKVRKIEIKTKRLSKQILSGEYLSAFKGKGMSFAEVREYTPGDEIRTIDWNVTARFNAPYIKVFEEERELSLVLMIDVSASMFFGSNNQLKKDYTTEIMAVLAFSAHHNNDKVGAILFSDKVEKFIPPKKGSKHISLIIRELINFKSNANKTNIKSALDFLNHTIKKSATVFILSDFYDENYEKSLKIARQKHDLYALHIYDQSEIEIPKIGLAQLYDNESKQYLWVNTNDKSNRKKQKIKNLKQKESIKNTLNRAAIKYQQLTTSDNYISALIQLFKH